MSIFFRVIDLAEMIINCQEMKGFNSRIAQLRTGDIETTRAEFETATLLAIFGIDAKFVEPSLRRGRDYDFEILGQNGVWFPSDTKCKVTGITAARSTVYNTLKGARTQFPADRPAIIFLRIPPEWNFSKSQIDTQTEINSGVRKFLGKTGRVAAVITHTRAVFPISEERQTASYCIEEFHNSQCRFPLPANWKLFSSTPPVSLRWKSLSRILCDGQFDGRYVLHR